MAQGRVMTVLFTDVVGSTERNVRLGPDDADALRRALDDTTGAVVGAQDGTLVKHLGDGSMAVFDSPSAGIEAAIEVQRGARRVRHRFHVDDLELRVGLALGEVVPEGEDWHGAAVVEAARLCDAASAGDVLVTDATLVLARGAFPAVSRGALELKGLPEPIAVSAVTWSDADAGVPLPAALLAGDALPFGGRARERAQLRDRWKAATAGDGGLVLLAGEPGIGKTRLAGELAAEVSASGATVLFGRNDEDLAAPYQPFVEAVGHLVTHRPPSVASDGLAHLLGGRGSGAAPDQVESLVVEAVRDVLLEAATEAPVLVVLDDLHWARPATLAVLFQLLRAIGDAPVLVVATYRDTDVDRTRPFGAFLARLRREGSVERIALDGLSVDEVSEVLEAAAGHDLGVDGEALAADLQAETAGNAFFVGEVLAHLIESGALVREGERWVGRGVVDLPEGVRDVVGRRLDELGPDVGDVLARAAVLGRSFTLTALDGLCRGDDLDVTEALDAALRARLVLEDGTGTTRFSFAHALVRHTLLAELTSVRRSRLHAEASELLIGSPDPRRHVEALHHALEGASSLPGDRFLETAIGGLGAHSELGAPSEVPDLVDRIIAVVDELGLDDPRCIDVLAFGEFAAVYALGDRERARALALRALERARRSGRDEDLVAAVAMLGDSAAFGLDPDFHQLLPEALRVARPGSEAERNLRGSQVMEAAFLGGDRPAVELGRQLVADVESHLRAGTLECASRSAAFSDEGHLALAQSTFAYAMQCGDDVGGGLRAAESARRHHTEMAPGAVALNRLATTYLQLRSGDPAAARRTADELIDGSAGLAIFRAAGHQVHATLALLTGDLAAAPSLIDRVAEAAGDEAMFEAGCLVQRGWLAHLQGDPAPILGDLGAIEMYPTAVAALRGVVAARTGDIDRARAEAAVATAEPVTDLAPHWAHPGTIQLLGDLAVELGDVELGAAVEPALEPFRGQLVLWTCTHVTGAASATLGRLAALRGDVDRARALLTEAEALTSAAGAAALAEDARRHLSEL